MCALTDSNGNRLTPVESFLFHASTARTPYKILYYNYYDLRYIPIPYYIIYTLWAFVSDAIMYAHVPYVRRQRNNSHIIILNVHIRTTYIYSYVYIYYIIYTSFIHR